ncbi:MAG: S9 family peptidase, partial [Planctomycetota bacterium]
RGDGWHAPSFRPDGGALVDSHSSVDMPTRRSWISCPADTRSFEIDAVELNLPGGLQPSQVLTIPAKDGYPLPAVIHPPLGDVPASGAPLLVEIYGGPQSASASNRWRETTRLYREWLNRRGVGVLVVDNRSSAARGSGDSWPIAGQFGAIELDDTLAAVNWLQNHRDWVDADRIAINGWSFGGYMVTYAMTHSDVFAAGIAGGSVTDWREYDAFYTERYMGLPQTNPDGYRAGGVLASANKLSGDLLLIHGEVDDNVHPTGTLRLADRLQRAGIPFDLMIYTSAAHGVRDPNQVWHLRQTIDRFLTRSLDLAEIASDSHSRGGGDSETRKTP